MGYKTIYGKTFLHCHERQTEIFEKLRETNPELYNQIISAAQKKCSDAHGRDVVVTLYKEVPGRCPQQCSIEEFSSLKSFEIRTQVAPSIIHEWTAENISVIGSK